MSVDVDVRALLRTPPEEFVATRDAMVKALKAEGRAEDAAALKRLRRPRVAEHALNLLAASRPDVARRWADHVDEVEAAQSAAIGGAGAERLRSVTAAFRTATAELIDAAVDELGAGGDTHRNELLELARRLATAGGGHLVRSGLVGSEQLAETELFAGAPEPAPATERPARAPKPARTPRRRPAADADEEAPSEPPPRRPPPDPAALRRARRAAERADRAAADARREVEQLRRELEAAEGRAAIAEAAAAEAAAALTALDGP